VSSLNTHYTLRLLFLSTYRINLTLLSTYWYSESNTIPIELLSHWCYYSFKKNFKYTWFI